jgi:hypothetical protein
VIRIAARSTQRQAARPPLAWKNAFQAEAKYTLVSDGKEYKVEPQEKLKGMGGQSVKVSGKVEGDTITVTSVEANA